jgi:hypothetical protein
VGTNGRKHHLGTVAFTATMDDDLSASKLGLHFPRLLTCTWYTVRVKKSHVVWSQLYTMSLRWPERLMCVNE